MSEVTEEVIENLAYRLLRADWSYMYSDDYSVYLKGEGEVKQITNDMKLYDWDLDNYILLVDQFFKVSATRFKDGIISNDYRDHWLNKISYLTGRQS